MTRVRRAIGSASPGLESNLEAFLIGLVAAKVV